MKDKFIKIVRENIKREGIDDLLEWLEQNGFYTDPASSRFHCDYEGGLCQHSINVYENLVKLNSIYNLCDSQETIAIVSLFHDCCKVNLYKQDYRNVKDENGTWNRVPYYSFDEKFAFGSHGGKSVFIINKFMKLTDLEAVCINAHMGQFDKPNGSYEITNAFEMFPFASLVHMADMISTYVDENKSLENKEENNLEKSIQEILDLFKKAISEKSIDKEEIYNMIAAENNGKRNPNSIKDIDVANKIITLLKEKL